MELGPNEKILTEEFGGRIGEWVKKITGKNITCVCGKRYEITEVIGYPHEGGLADKDKKVWWPYIVCPKCGYQLAYWKIDVRLARE